MFCRNFYADLAEIKYGPAEDLCHDILEYIMEEKEHTYVQLWDNINETVDHVVNRSSVVLHVWQQHRQRVSAGADQPEVRMTENWIPLPTSYVKCSLDAAFFADEQCLCVGMCARDDYGKFIVAKTNWCSASV